MLKITSATPSGSIRILALLPAGLIIAVVAMLPPTFKLPPIPKPPVTVKLPVVVDVDAILATMFTLPVLLITKLLVAPAPTVPTVKDDPLIENGA